MVGVPAWNWSLPEAAGAAGECMFKSSRIRKAISIGDSLVMHYELRIYAKLKSLIQDLLFEGNLLGSVGDSVNQKAQLTEKVKFAFHVTRRIYCVRLQQRERLCGVQANGHLQLLPAVEHFVMGSFRKTLARLTNG